MKKKLLIMALSITLIATLTACGASTSATEADSGGTVEETAATEPETGTAEAATATAERVEWLLDDIAVLGDIITGITDREYEAGSGAARKIREDISYDHDVMYTVLTDTAAVWFDVPGEYEMTYWVYFDAAALSSWADENGMDLDIPDAGRLAVSVRATVTVTETKEEETEEDAEDAGNETDDADGGTSTASGSAGSTASGGGSSGASESGGSSGSAKSASSGSSKNSSSSSSSNGSSSATECDHNWVEITKEEDVYEAKEVEICNLCKEDITGHANEHLIDHLLAHEGGGWHTEWVSVKVGTQTVGTGTYVCSKCGVTK